MIILTKKLGTGEVNWKGVVVPRHKKDSLPPPGVPFDLSDGKTTYTVKVDKQFRLRLTEWFNNHPGLKKGDEVIFTKENGTMQICIAGSVKDKVVSVKELLGKETAEGRIIDVQLTAQGPVVVLQGTKEKPLEEVLNVL